MKAYISIIDGKSRIELIDDCGFYHDIIEVDEIHVELNRENIEPFIRKTKNKEELWKH